MFCILVAGNPKDKVIILERELSSAQTRIVQLEQLASGLEKDKDELLVSVRDYQRVLAEKEDQLQELLGETFKMYLNTDFIYMLDLKLIQHIFPFPFLNSISYMMMYDHIYNGQKYF